MSSLFNDFSDTYKRFQRECPYHPLNEEVRHRILRGRFPTNQWLRSQIKRMNEIMAPIWLSTQASRSGRKHVLVESPTDAGLIE